MEGIREYLLSVTAAAMLCGIVSALTGEKGSQAGLVKLACGLFLCFTVISPFAKIKIEDFSDFASEIVSEGELAAREGENYSAQAMRRIISDETRAYIMDKAGTYGAKIQVQVELTHDDPPVPEACTISGQLSPYVRQQLKKILTNDLGIPEENQTWIQ